MKHLFITLSSILLLNNWVSGQVKIQGQVTDKDGAIAHITVSLINREFKIKNKTNTDGNYTISSVPRGSYDLIFSASNYKKRIVKINQLNQDTVINVNLEERTSELDEVEVSGQASKYTTKNVSPSLRLQTPILELPQNIQVVTKDILQQQQIFNALEGLGRNISGITRTVHWENYANLKMRGARIGAFRNGMNITSTWGPLAEDVSIIENAEFIKGPAGFLLASGDAAGSYNVVTKKPTGNTKNEVILTYGSYQTMRTQIDLDGRLKANGKLWYRFNAAAQSNQSFRANEYGRRVTIAPSLRYNFNANTQLTAEYIYNFNQSSLTGSQYVFSDKGYKNLPQNFSISPINPAPTNVNDHNLMLNFSHQLNNDWSFTVQSSYMNAHTFGVSQWLNEIKDGRAYRYLSLWDGINTNYIAQAFVNGKIQTGKVSHKLMSGIDAGKKINLAQFGPTKSIDDQTGGFDIYNNTNNVRLEDNFIAKNFDTSKPFKERASWIDNQEYAGLYIQDEIGLLNNKIRLTLGGRYTLLKQENSAKTFSINQKFTPRIGLSGSIAPNTSAYFLYDQAFSAQFGKEYNNGKPTNVKPLLGENLELGLKKDWFDGKWNTALAIYQIYRNNVTTPDVANSNAGQSYLLTLGQTQTRGIELDIKGEIIPHLNLIFNYAYTLSTITKSTDQTTIGTLVPGFAKHVNNLWLNYKFAKGYLKNFGASLGYQLLADRVPNGLVSFNPTDVEKLPNYFRIDGGIFYQKDKWNINLNINNILNEYLIDGAPYGYTKGVSYFYQAEAPRNFRLSVGYKF